MISNQSIGIGIYVYNGAEYIKRALSSILIQTVKVDKIFISDNCSTDNTIGLIDEFISDHPDLKVTFKRNKDNLGFLRNAEIVIDMADTYYLLLLHADDYLLENSIELLLNEHIRNPSLALVAGFDHIIDRSGNYIRVHTRKNNILFQKGDILEFIMRHQSYLPFSSVLHKTKVLKEIKLNFNSKICDELYWPKVLSFYPIMVLGDAVLIRTSHEDQTTNSYAHNPSTIYSFYKEHIRVFQYDKRPECRISIKRLMKNNYAEKLMGLAIHKLKYFEMASFLSSLYYLFLIKPDYMISNNMIYKKLIKKLGKNL
jgi:glycosyltransferase involved in cell wall biosynthesis